MCSGARTFSKVPEFVGPKYFLIGSLVALGKVALVTVRVTAIVLKKLPKGAAL
jgi:hypothetical protein